MKFISRTVSSIVLGLSVCGVSGYLLYLLLKRDEEELDFVITYEKSIEIKVPKEQIHLLIGRNGRNLKLIETQSNTKISFKDKETAREQTCLVQGTRDGCRAAEKLIKDFIRNQPEIVCEDVWVPQSSVLKVVGRCGEKIFDISSASGAKITVLDDDKTTATRRIIIKGTQAQIDVAKSLIENVVQESKESQMRLESVLAKREPRLPLKSPGSGSPKPLIESPKSEKISSSDDQFEVYVSAMVSPSRFWLQIVGPKATELDLLVDEMTEYYNKPENRELHVLEKIEKGDLVAAVFQYDGKWYRAEVLDVKRDSNKDEIELYFVDYGDADIVPFSELFELRTDFLKLHFQAIECYLARVEPVGSDWSNEAKDRFEELTHVACWQKLSAKYNGCDLRERARARREGSPVPGVDLFDIHNDHDVDIAQELVSQGFAVYKKEADLRSSRATSVGNISNASSS